jgi:competence protein ComEA
MNATPPPAATNKPPPLLSAWPRSVQTATAVALALATVVLTIRSIPNLFNASDSSDAQTPAEAAYQIDLNSAERAELLQLPGVGEALAQRILDYRRERGRFRRVEELRGVRGIGPVTMERLRPWIRVSDPDDPAARDEFAARSTRLAAAHESKSDSVAPIPTSKKLTKYDAPLDLNQATAEELQRLPGIGPKLSAAIVAARLQKPFATVDDLRRVKGIGAKTLEKIRLYATVGSSAHLAQVEH